MASGASGLRDRWGYPRVGGMGRLYQQLGRLERENAALREQVDRLQNANQHLQARVRKLTGQVEEDLPPPRSSVITRYQVQIGRCRGCRRRIQPRHPEQTSDALGAAGVQVGPRAVALAAWASKGLGLPAAKVARLLGQLGLKVTPGGVVQALHRAARRAAPTYQALVDGIQASPVVAPDETGWRVAGRRVWLWAFAGQGVVVYRIAAGRGFKDAAVVLGEGNAGVLNPDGWAPYRQSTTAAHQSCRPHLLRRGGKLLMTPSAA